VTLRASVIVCTHNRAHRLDAALRSAIGQDLGVDTFEIVVIDNASTDDTRAVVTRFGDRVRYIMEPELGLANARNTGWRNARAPIVAYLDDDAVASSGWIGAIAACFDRAEPPACAGGPVQPMWEATRPDWLADELLTALTILDWPGGAHAITDLGQEWLAGANMAIPRTVLEQVGGFAAGLDRSGTRLLSSGDVHLQKQIAARGLTVWYDPEIIIAHAIPASRLNRRWFRERYWAQGLSDAMMQILEMDLQRHPLRRVRAAGSAAMRLLARPRDLAALLREGDDATAFRDHCFARIGAGHVAGLAGAV
jgi:glycosyltransferase involved in cell wall biosynthesis